MIKQKYGKPTKLIKVIQQVLGEQYPEQWVQFDDGETEADIVISHGFDKNKVKVRLQTNDVNSLTSEDIAIIEENYIKMTQDENDFLDYSYKNGEYVFEVSL